ncbi:E3 ubiquitin-protein ligase MARCHF7 isoform 2-T2 [Pholidichthys leucotaenia]
MDSWSPRLPFRLSSSRPAYRSGFTHSTPSSSSSLGYSRLYSRETTLNNHFPRASSPYKADLDKPNSHLLSSSSDYSSSGSSRSASWKLPSLTSSSSSYDNSWAGSSVSSRNRLTESERKLGIGSGLLNSSDDADSKRAKLSNSNRGLFSRTSSTSVTGSTYSSNGLNRGEKRSDSLDSPWSSCRLLSRSSLSSKPLVSRREQEPSTDPGLSGLGDRRTRTPGLVSSLCQTDRVMSTYAQGARPKETNYFSARESSINRQLSSSDCRPTSPQMRNFGSRTSTRSSNSSSSLHSSQEQTGSFDSSSDVSSSYSSHAPWSAAPLTPPDPVIPRPTPEGAGPEGRRSTRRLLSRLFSWYSSQDSSSSSTSVRSLDDDSPSTSGESVDSDDGGKLSSVDPDTRGADRTQSSPRNLGGNLTSIQENGDDNRSSWTRPRVSSWRESGVSSSREGSNSSSSSFLSSSFRGRYPPILSRLRRQAVERTDSTSGSEDGFSHPQQLPSRWDDLEHKAQWDDDEEDEEEEGAVGLVAFGTGRSWRLEDDTLPDLEDASIEFSPRRHVGVYENHSASVSPLCAAESGLGSQGDKTASSRDQEKLRKIKERLLLEDSDEEEGDLCRICQMAEKTLSNPLIQPCGCTGSLQYVHQECIKRWLLSKISSGTNLEAVTTCELCKEKLSLKIDNFDIQELYRTHVQLFYLVRSLHEGMASLESSQEEIDDEVPDHRPSVEFSDLDDDLEEEY